MGRQFERKWERESLETERMIDREREKEKERERERKRERERERERGEGVESG